MDYEKAYKHALDLAKQVHDTTISKQQKENIEIIFPELRKSEDERIREELIKETKGSDVRLFEIVTNDEFIAWLEKQDEQKPAEWHREDEQNLNACLGFIPDEFLRRWLTDIIYAKYDKSAWSEEDELMLLSTIQSLETTNGAAQMKIDWLKNIKQRIGG